MGVLKLGPCGGHITDCSKKDMDYPHNVSRVTKLIIGHSDTGIESFQFAYQNNDGSQDEIQQWGKTDATHKAYIYLAPDEYINSVSGYFGDTTCPNVLRSLKIHTNHHNGPGAYGPYGKEEGTTFNFPVHRGGKIVGFYGATGNNFIKSLGVYIFDGCC
ncbi:hypothetical protein LUZ60_014823 [Juncus effusus]|nr:hypothetical protein LUZ60_014823 [Juncus effusus]